MAKSKKDQPKIEDEPGAEDRFMSGVRKALGTPPNPHKPKPSKKRGKQ